MGDKLLYVGHEPWSGISVMDLDSSSYHKCVRIAVQCWSCLHQLADPGSGSQMAALQPQRKLLGIRPVPAF